MKHSKAILGIIVLLFLLSGCASQSISNIKNPENVGETVAIKGTVENSIKLGAISGYTLRDKNGDTIGVSSNYLPDNGETVTVSGVLMKDTFLGYYIKVK